MRLWDYNLPQKHCFPQTRNSYLKNRTSYAIYIHTTSFSKFYSTMIACKLFSYLNGAVDKRTLQTHTITVIPVYIHSSSTFPASKSPAQEYLCRIHPSTSQILSLRRHQQPWASLQHKQAQAGRVELTVYKAIIGRLHWQTLKVCIPPCLCICVPWGMYVCMCVCIGDV